VERDKAPFGVLMTLREPTSPMVKEAAAAGFLETAFGKFPRLQIVTIRDLLDHKYPKLPPQEVGGGYKQAPKEIVDKQAKLI
jgi:site-specific DNA-methyltransferase (adenine-specific)